MPRPFHSPNAAREQPDSECHHERRNANCGCPPEFQFFKCRPIDLNAQRVGPRITGPRFANTSQGTSNFETVTIVRSKPRNRVILLIAGQYSDRHMVVPWAPQIRSEERKSTRLNSNHLGI